MIGMPRFTTKGAVAWGYAAPALLAAAAPEHLFASMDALEQVVTGR